MKIEKIVKGHVVSVSVSTSAKAALKLLEDSNLSLAPVLEDGRLVGIVTSEQLKEKANGITVKSVMQKPIFVEKEKSIDYAIKYLLKHRINRVPVVESEIGMRCIGIVTASDLLKAKKLMQQ